jgi:hypothetical protein
MLQSPFQACGSNAFPTRQANQAAAWGLEFPSSLSFFAKERLIHTNLLFLL